MEESLVAMKSHSRHTQFNFIHFMCIIKEVKPATNEPGFQDRKMICLVLSIMSFSFEVSFIILVIYVFIQSMYTSNTYVSII